MDFEKDKLKAFNKTLRDYMVEIKKIATENPGETTNRIASLAKMALHFTEY